MQRLMPRRTFTAALAAWAGPAVCTAVGASLLPRLARAEAGPYPNHALRLIVPTAPGGGADFLARAVGRRLSEQLGQTVVIENRPGAAGNTSADYVAHQPGDGYLLFIGAVATLAINPTLYKSLPYDPVKDFAPITMGVVLSNILVAHPSVPANNVRELIALARDKPGSINFGSSGNGTSGHLAGELFAMMAGVKMTHIPYKGGGPAMNDLLAGQVQISFASPPSALPFVKTGRLKALGVTTDYRLAALPEVPTIAESGLPGFSANNWYCFVASPGTPSDIVERLNLEIHKAMAAPDVKAVLVAQGMDPAPGTPAALTAFIKSEMDKWGKVIRAGKFTAE
jgi:tripartite-type tricarboxylate transporter receptor subunit TctC